MSKPFVSLVTPTYNRRRFIPSLLKLVEAQTYPKDKMEWILVDDGQDSVQDLFEAAKGNPKLPTIRYIRREEKMTLGEKRNLLNQEAKGEILVALDDDDYYMPDRVAAAVHALQSKPQVDLAGASEIYMYFSDTKEIWRFGPYGPNHATNGTMAWRKRYAATHRYNEDVSFAEEKSFLESYKNPLVQINPMKVMLVMSHSENTFDKSKIRDPGNPMAKKTTMKLKDFIKDSALREFYTNA
jgi:glycosyltransferase involved in cell wall biosynthesis